MISKKNKTKEVPACFNWTENIFTVQIVYNCYHLIKHLNNRGISLFKPKLALGPNYNQIRILPWNNIPCLLTESTTTSFFFSSSSSESITIESPFVFPLSAYFRARFLSSQLQIVVQMGSIWPSAVGAKTVITPPSGARQVSLPVFSWEPVNLCCKFKTIWPSDLTWEFVSMEELFSGTDDKLEVTGDFVKFGDGWWMNGATLTIEGFLTSQVVCLSPEGWPLVPAEFGCTFLVLVWDEHEEPGTFVIEFLVKCGLPNCVLDDKDFGFGKDEPKNSMTGIFQFHI